ncbi:MAG: glycosyltransferase [Clostridiales bacterium]|nr:glycosyltransferase [Clostridiales bacterium]
MRIKESGMSSDDRKHTICLLNDSFPPIIDGVANAVLNYAKYIERDHGHAIVVTPHISDADDSNYDFPVVRYPSIDLRKHIGYVAGYPFSPEAAHIVESSRVSLLHTHCPVTSCILARQLAESMQLPLVLTWHTKYDIDIAKAVRGKALQEGAIRALLYNVNACDEVWTVSKGAGENLRSLGYEGEYIVMPNGVDLPHEQVSDDLVAEVTAGYDLPDGVPVFLFIGRLMWYKGLRIILDALAALKAQDIDFRMVFIGGGGDETEVREYTAELGLLSKVYFAGVISDREKLRAWYRRSDLFLFPSTFDTNGLVVREAAASDTAAVVIEGSCAAEDIEKDINGFFIEENADALAAKLRELAADPDRMKTVGEAAGRDLYMSWEDAVANAYTRYEVVIDRYKSGCYKTRLPYDYDFFRANGELMETLGDLDAARRAIQHDAEVLREDIDRTVRSKKNKAMTEIITAGYELSTQLRETADAFWEFLDRYL